MKKILIVSALLIFAFAGCKQKEEKPQYEFPVGPAATVQSMEQIKLAQEAAAKDPKNADAWTNLGNLMMDSSRFSEAAEAYQKSLDIDPNNVNVRVDMGTCYRNMGKPDMAATEYRKALELDPKHLQALKNMGVVLAYDLRDTNEAVKMFEKALEIAPNAPDADRMKQEIQKLKAAK